jgi:hypothetical protein
MALESPSPSTGLGFELLIIGYQSLVWMALAVCLLPGNGDILVRVIKDWKEVAAIASVFAAYTLGAITNGIAAPLFSWLEQSVYAQRPEKKPSEMRAAILIQDPKAFEHIMKNFDVPRILRSTVINILLIGMLLIIHNLVSNTAGLSLFWIVLATLAAALVTLWAWYETAENYFIHLYRTFDEVEKINRK